MLTSPATEYDGPAPSFPYTLHGSAAARAEHLFMWKDQGMITGIVKFFNYDRGYGFISNDAGGADAFVHITAVEAAGLPGLNKDQKVSYELETDPAGKTSAVKLQAA
jgi:CspA family cold shock protein